MNFLRVCGFAALLFSINYKILGDLFYIIVVWYYRYINTGYLYYRIAPPNAREITSEG